MTPNQCRMARAGLNLTIRDLAREADVSVNTVNRFEAGLDARLSSVGKMQRALQRLGAIFVFEEDGTMGVRITPKKDSI